MFAGIHGAQRSGKSYFCIRTCIDFLRNTKRDLYTNLPVNPDFMAQFVCGKKLRNPDKYYDLFKRIHIFKTFDSFGEARSFAKKNRDFWRSCRFTRKYKLNFFKEYLSSNGGKFPSRSEWSLEYYEAGNIWPEDWLVDFWVRIKRKRTVFMFDEYYQIHSSMDYKSKGVDLRLKLLSFTREHGHDNHHVYLISHKPDDLDKVIRDGFMNQYFVENAKHKNLFKNKWLRGFRSPIQYFRIYGYVQGDKEPQDVYPIWPDKAIFKCYDSNSTGSTLKDINMGECEADEYDDNRGHDFLHNFKVYFSRQGWVTFVVLTSVFFGGYTLYKGYKSIIPSKVKTGITDKKNISQLNNNQQGRTLAEDLKVTGVFSNKVIWSDSFKLQIGDMYHGLTVKKINHKNETIVFARPDNKLFAVPFNGCRIAEKPRQPVRPETKR